MEVLSGVKGQSPGVSLGQQSDIQTQAAADKCIVLVQTVGLENIDEVTQVRTVRCGVC